LPSTTTVSSLSATTVPFQIAFMHAASVLCA